MSFHIPFRSFNRSQRERVGGVQLVPATSAWVNVDSPRIQRDLARHSAIGALVQVGDGLGFTSDGYLQDGVAVTKAAVGSLNLSVSVGRVVRSVANGSAVVTVPAVTGTPAVIAGANATGPRIDVICVNTTSGAITVEQGTTAGVANANLFNRLSIVADLPANRIPVALVYLPVNTANVNLDTATIVPLR